MKILYVCTISNTVNLFLIPHIRMLVHQGHQVDIACNIVQALDPSVSKLGCRVYNISFQRNPLHKENFHAYKKVKEVIEEQRYDLIHTHTPVASACTRIACINNKNGKVIYTAHGFHFFKGAPLKNWLIYYPLEKWLSKYTDCLITINHEDFENCEKYRLRAQETVCISGVGVDLEKFYPLSDEEKNRLRKKHGYNEDETILIFPAELNKNKNQGLLISVVKELVEKSMKVKLLLPGSGSFEKHYVAKVREMDLQDHVKFVGYSDNIVELLQISDVGVSSSQREGLPVNIMEAMASGLPVVATDCRGNRDLIKDGENGYLIELGDIETFVHRILALHEHPLRKKDFGLRSRNLVHKYSLQNILTQMDEIYSRYLAQ